MGLGPQFIPFCFLSLCSQVSHSRAPSHTDSPRGSNTYQTPAQYTHVNNSIVTKCFWNQDKLKTRNTRRAGGQRDRAAVAEDIFRRGKGGFASKALSVFLQPLITTSQEQIHFHLLYLTPF